VIGVDVNGARVALARELGAMCALDPAAGDWVAQMLRLSDGAGADAVIVTASSSSPQVIAEALRCCRRKARVVVVGDVSLQIERADLYAKELDLLISTSYGPGRYDPFYEEGGQDYPLPYVRWTENRNMRAYLALLAAGELRLEPLRAGVFEVDAASAAYEALKTDHRMIAVLSYPARQQAERRRVALPRTGARSRDSIGVALVGAGGFAQGMHLPNLVKLRQQFALRAVVSRTGANAKAVATHYGAAYATTALDDALSDSQVQLVMIATRHDQHATMALAALRAGKHVFVEKPLAITPAQLERIEEFYAQRGAEAPLLMTGFNRRFAPAISRVCEAVRARSAPLIVNYRMNAGYLPATHWVHGPEGGGRNIGEGCHIYDLFQALTGASWTECSALSIRARAGQFRADDNFVATASYTDGSVCSLTYTALGAKDYPKERMDVFCDGMVLSVDDYRSLSCAGRSGPSWNAAAPNKGQFEELQALGHALREGGPWPISLADQLAATRLSFAVDEALRAPSTGG
jgi:predicted dehydrogenase